MIDDNEELGTGVPACGCADFRYAGPINQAVIVQIVKGVSVVAVLSGWSELTENRVKNVVVELGQNIAEHALASGTERPERMERLGELVVGHDASGVFVETRFEVASTMVEPLKRNYEHLRLLSDAELEAEYIEVITRRVRVPGERNAGLYAVARSAVIGGDGRRRLSLEAHGTTMDSKVYVN